MAQKKPILLKFCPVQPIWCCSSKEVYPAKNPLLLRGLMSTLCNVLYQNVRELLPKTYSMLKNYFVLH